MIALRVDTARRLLAVCLLAALTACQSAQLEQPADTGVNPNEIGNTNDPAAGFANAGPGSEEDEYEPFEDWLAHDMGGPGDKPEATFVAFAGDEVVGYSKFSLIDAQPTVAFHDLTGVKRAWRGRGIASALKRTQMAWAKEHGYERLSTNNEERNEPIRRLNERHGYRPVPGRIFVRGPVESAPSR